MTRIVQLTTYPLKSPRHGGQLRCAAIRERYRTLGFEVTTIAAIHGTDYRPSDHEPDDLVLPVDHTGFDAKLARFTDMQSGRIIANDPAFWRAFTARMQRLAPDAIALEQPWLYPAAKRWRDERAAAGDPVPKLIYSSQNIEWKLKRDETADAVFDVDLQRHVVAKAEALERNAVRDADLVIACTDEELAELRALAGAGAKASAWVVAHNAIAPYAPDPARVAAMKKKLGIERYPLFVGSAHPPNANGFWEMLGPSLAFLKPEGERIVVAGGVSHLLRQHRLYSTWPAINEPRLLVMGEVEREDLVSLIGGASVILLPITTGGGSNLKTAEAIYSGKPVLATPHALRGYGDASRWPTITVASTADEYRRALRRLLDAPDVALPADYATRREEVTWSHALAPLTGAVARLFGAPARRASLDAAQIHDAEVAATRTRVAEIGAAIARRGGVDYERLLERQYLRFLQAGDVVVDIGAHAGRHLARFVERVGRNGRVHAFEPLPEMFAGLQRRFAAANVTLHNVALTDTEGRLEFVHAVGSPEESGLRERVYNNPAAVKPTRIEVVAEKLDRHVDALDGLAFVKIDVEGAEMNVLRGATGVLARYRPIVSVEYGRPAYSAYGNETFTLFDFAERHDYAMYDIFGHRLGRAAWSVACDSAYWDYFMVPTEREAEFAKYVQPLGPEAIE